MAQDDDATSLEVALGRYFEANQLGADGGYSARWVTGMLGPIPFAFPNIEARRSAVRFHDLHHLVTGYETDGPGEIEISAWEIASGCGRFWAAWYLNLMGLAAGLVLAPRRAFRAFVRGRQSRNLYGTEYGPELLGRAVSAVRDELLPGEDSAPSAADRAAFAFWMAVGLAGVLAQLGLIGALGRALWSAAA